MKTPPVRKCGTRFVGGWASAVSRSRPRAVSSSLLASAWFLRLLGWIVWATTTSFIGTRVFKGTTDMGEMLRVLGFAQSPRVIGVIPFLGPVAAVWVLVASVVAIREGLDFSTGRAIGTAIGGWLVWIVLQQATSVLVTAVF